MNDNQGEAENLNLDLSGSKAIAFNSLHCILGHYWHIQARCHKSRYTAEVVGIKAITLLGWMYRDQPHRAVILLGHSKKTSFSLSSLPLQYGEMYWNPINMIMSLSE